MLDPWPGPLWARLKATPGTRHRASRMNSGSHGGARPVLGSSGSVEIESIEIHDLVPRSDEVVHELLLCVVARIDLRECS